MYIDITIDRDDIPELDKIVRIVVTDDEKITYRRVRIGDEEYVHAVKKDADCSNPKEPSGDVEDESE